MANATGQQRSIYRGLPPFVAAWGWLEWMLVLSILALLGQLAAPYLYRWHRGPGAGRQGIVEFSTLNVSPSVAREALVYLPVDYHSRRDKPPLLLYLHGAGERGDEIQLVTQRGLPKFLGADHAYPMVVVSPQCRPGNRWRSDELLKLVDEVVTYYQIDESRVGVLGESMGGYGAWSIGAADPEKFAALMPLCGGGDTETADRLAGVPIWAFHGAEDKVVPLSGSKAMVEAVQKAGGSARLSVLPHTGHDLGGVAVRPDVIAWLLSQRRDHL